MQVIFGCCLLVAAGFVAMGCTKPARVEAGNQSAVSASDITLEIINIQSAENMTVDVKANIPRTYAGFCISKSISQSTRIELREKKTGLRILGDVPDIFSSGHTQRESSDFSVMRVPVGETLYSFEAVIPKSPYLADESNKYIREYFENDQIIAFARVILFDCKYEKMNDALIADDYLIAESIGGFLVDAKGIP